MPTTPTTSGSLRLARSLRSVRFKLLVLLWLPLGLLATAGGFEVLRSTRAASFAGSVANTVELASHISRAVHELQRERGFTAGFLGSGGTRFAAELQTQQRATDEFAASLAEAIEIAEAQDPNLARGPVGQELSSAEAQLNRLSSLRARVQNQAVPTREAVAFYSGVNATLLDAVGEGRSLLSGSTLKGQVAAYHAFLMGKEKAGVERAVLSNVFAMDRFDEGGLAQLVRIVSEQDTWLSAFLHQSNPAGVEAFTRATSETNQAVERFRRVAFESPAAGGFGQDPTAWFNAATRRIDALKATDDALSGDILAAARADARRASSAVWLTLGCTSALLLVLGAGGLWVLRSLIGRLDALTHRLEEIAEGEADLTGRIDASGQDELARLGSAFNRFIARIHDLVVEAARVSEEVSKASAEIARSTQDMAGGLRRQDEQTRQAAAGLEEMSRTVESVVAKSAGARTQASQAGEQASRGGQVVEQTVEAIGGIAQVVEVSAGAVSSLGARAEEIGQIISVINGVADQTNLLALNAAIEAARAGEHGRGFAVVADEVRKLAERTTEATEEVAASIRSIQEETRLAVSRMGEGTQRVSHGVLRAREAGDALEHIVAGAEATRARIAEIDVELARQAQVTGGIGQRVRDIDGLTGESARSAGQIADAATELSDRSGQLQTLIRQFRTAA